MFERLREWEQGGFRFTPKVLGTFSKLLNIIQNNTLMIYKLSV